MPRPRASLFVAAAAALAVGGCASAAPSSPPAVASTPQATEAPSAPAPTASAASPTLPEGSPGPTLTFTFASKVPVLTPDGTRVPEEIYVNPGAIVEHDGKLHMFANTFSSFPGTIEIVHLVSTDGRAWTPHKPNPTVPSTQVPVDAGGIDVSTGFVDAKGTWVLLYSKVQNGEPWTISRLTAPGPNGPWVADASPILAGGPEATDSAGVGWATVVQIPSGYAAYYEGMSGPNVPGVIEMATSADGRTWTKSPRPVLTADRPWEGGGVGRPTVSAIAGGYLMVYSDKAVKERGVAWSTDGTTWTKGGLEPAITEAIYPVVAKPYDAALSVRGKTVSYYLELLTRLESDVYLATAELP
jgi:predicted GH43/DUF377 family glycosyl hydrolase